MLSRFLPPYRRLSPGLFFALAFSAAGARAARLSVVVDSNTGSKALVEALERTLGAGNKIQVFDVRKVNLSNPMEKGRFLSQVSAADLVIPIGDPASRLVTDELEDYKTFFIAAGGLSGKVLERRQVAGILSYSPEETVRVAKALLPKMKNVGVLFTPGYDRLVLRLRAAAAQGGLSMTAYEVESRRDVGPAIRQAAAHSDLVWTVGDPVFTQDLIFTYLLQESIRLKKPLAAPLPNLVDKGALFCTVPDNADMARLASQSLARLLTEGPPPESDRIRTAPAGGTVLLNRRLMENWGIDLPSSLRLWNDRVP